MQTKTAITLAGNATELAEILNITLSAISQWGENIPELRVYKLRELRPDWFPEVRANGDVATEKQLGAKSYVS